MRSLLWLSLLAQVSQADTITETFTDASKFLTTGTAVVNLVSHTIHLPWIVDRVDNATEAEDDSVNVGTGADGEFSSSTYASFDTAGGNDPSVITLDSSRTYQFTTFTLDASKTLYVSGRAPLVMRVQGNVTINGTINLNGAGATGGPGAGGTGTASSTPGSASGGGGGGGYDTLGVVGVAGAGGAGGTAGSSYGNVYLTTVAVGSGGGAGGAYTIGAAAAQSAGGSGGAGGGAISIHAGGNILIETTGSILANGSNGSGFSSGTILAGSGGGGSGGAILCFAGGTFINRGSINADKGNGGSGSGGGNGGNGGLGRTRFVDSTLNLASNPGGILETPEPNMGEFGRIFYSKTTHQIESTAYDTGNSSPTYNSLTVTESKPTGTSITYTFAGSNDNFVSDSTDWVSRSDLSTLSGKRYIKFRAALSTTNRSVTPTISAFAIDYTSRTQDEFRFKAAGCGSVKAPKTDWTGGFLSLLWLVPVLLVPRLSRFASRS